MFGQNGLRIAPKRVIYLHAEMPYPVNLADLS